MSSKVYKGQGVIITGSLSGETIIVTKFSYNSRSNLEYLGEAKIGSKEEENKFFIKKYIYDNKQDLIEIRNATNRTSVGANIVSVDKTSDPMYVIISLSDLGDFSEVRPEDSVSLVTSNNKFDGLQINKVSEDKKQIFLLKEKIPSNMLLAIIDENLTDIAETDLMVQLNHEDTKDYAKRRWSHRNRYVYA